ncbi:MAG: glycosyltransferase [Planctomycetota bacterium]
MGYSISLVLVTRNRCDELKKTLISLKKQDAEFELILVDNGSDDESLEIVREYWPNAVTIQFCENKGVCVGRNKGLKAATGDIIVFLDDDASFRDSDAISRMVKKFQENQDLGILATSSYLTSSGQPEYAAIPRKDKKIFENDCPSSYFCGVGFALRRELIAKTGNFFEGYFYSCEEIDLSWRAIECGYQIIWTADIVVLHRRSLLERAPGRWIYSNARNRVWLAMRHLPWRYVVSYAVTWWGFLFVKSIMSFSVPVFFRGVVDCITGSSAILKERNVLSNSTLKIIRSCSGRLLY